LARRVVIQWAISSFTGWGVYGLNLALHWAGDAELSPTASRPINPGRIVVDPLRRRALAPLIADAAQFQSQLRAHAGRPATVEAVVLTPANEAFEPLPAAHGVTLTGRPTLAVTFFETGRLSPEAVARAAAFPLIVTGSTWNQRVLEAHGLTRVRTVLQGVDDTLFHPAPRAGVMGDRFAVFSGGKLERRKGQDIVVAAFRRFARRRPDALLVTAWRSPWPKVARTADISGLAAPVTFDADGGLDVVGWAAANGVGADQVLDLGAVPNAQLPTVLREMDVAVFPNRCEGGTNLVAMEAMACGVPTVLSRNTGHLDLIAEDNCYVLERQAEGTGEETGWGESDVDELVAALERAYVERDAARRLGLRGAETVRRLSWSQTARQMKAIVLSAGDSARA
jgi:glycosyltransferase involved in cell wall biosynthesis